MPDVAINLIIVLLLILLNGVFAMAELAVVSARRARLQQMAEEGNKGAETALSLAETPNRFLSTVQVGITLVGIFAGAFGGATIAAPLASLLEGIPVVSEYSQGISLVLVVSLITFLSVVLGELVPKRLALQSAEQVASLVSRPMQALAVLATPIVRLLSLATDAVLQVLGIQASTEAEVTEEEIRVLVREGARAGIIKEAEREMVEQVFLLDDRPLEQLMTPRPSIVWLDVKDTLEANREIVARAPHSRFPVADGELDAVVGIVRAKDLLTDCLRGQPLALTEAMQEPLYLPGSMRALHALERFRQTGTHLGLVVDEFGGIDGLVSLIDILEAIVGDIPTIDELADPPIVERGDGSWLVEGLLAVDEFKMAFDVRHLPGEGSYQTLGGFIVYMIGDTPVAGNVFDWNGYRFEVVDMDGYRVDKVLVKRVEETTAS